MNDKIILASRLIDTLNRSKRFTAVTLTGSLASESADQYSDIDIIIENNSFSSYKNVLAATEIISKEYPLLFHDFARSLLPDCIVTLYLKDHPLFSTIDIACTHNGNFPAIQKSEVAQNRLHHQIKLWVCNAKYYLRNDLARQNIDMQYNRIFPADSHKSVREKLLAVYTAEIADKSELEVLLKEKIKNIADKITK